MKNSRAQLSDLKIQNCLDFMRESYSTTEHRTWNAKEVTTTFEIGASFPAVLEKLGYIKRKHGTIMLTSKFASLRPSTVRKNMNKMIKEWQQNRVVTTNTSKKVRVKTTPEATGSDLVSIFTMLKEKIREEVINELKQSIKSEL